MLRAPDLGDARHDAAFVSRLRERLPPQVSVVAPAQAVAAPAAARAAAPTWAMYAGMSFGVMG